MKKRVLTIALITALSATGALNLVACGSGSEDLGECYVLTKHVTYDELNRTQSMYEYERDESGNIVAMTQTSAVSTDGESKTTGQYSIGDDGLPAEASFAYYDGTGDTYTYACDKKDGDQQPLERSAETASGNAFAAQYDYYGLGQPKSTTTSITYSGTTEKQVCEYDESGRLTALTYYLSGDSPLYTKTFTYEEDDQGRVSKMHEESHNGNASEYSGNYGEFDTDSVYSYEYDENGNVSAIYFEYGIIYDENRKELSRYDGPDTPIETFEWTKVSSPSVPAYLESATLPLCTYVYGGCIISL